MATGRGGADGKRARASSVDHVAEVLARIDHRRILDELTRPWTMPGSPRSVLGAAIRKGEHFLDAGFMTDLTQPHTLYAIGALAKHGCRVVVDLEGPTSAERARPGTAIFPNARSEAIFGRAREYLRDVRGQTPETELAVHVFETLVAIYCRTGWFTDRKKPFAYPGRPEFTTKAIAILAKYGYELEDMKPGIRVVGDLVCRTPVIDPRAPDGEDWEWAF